MRRGLLIGVASFLVFATVVVCTLPDSPRPASAARSSSAARAREVAPSPPTVAAADPLAEVATEANRGDTQARSRMCAESMSAAEKSGIFKDAAYWCALAAEAGDASSQAAYARLYQLGEGVAQDDAQAAFWYEKAIMQRHAHAMYMRGRMLMASNDAADDARGRVLLEEAAALGDPNARWAVQEQAAELDGKQQRPRTLIR
jgi:TPR repeat protein